MTSYFADIPPVTFAPDAEGFTIVLAAEGPGTFAAAGYYELARG